MTEVSNAEKLRIAVNDTIWVIATSEEESALLDPLPEGAEMVEEATDGMRVAILFVDDWDELLAEADEVLPQLGSTPSVWISHRADKPNKIEPAAVSELVEDFGWQCVETVELGDGWSAVRLEQS